MRLRSKRGQMLVQVLVTVVMVAVIGAALMRLVLMRLTVADRLVSGGQGKVAAQSGYQLLLNYWQINGTCSNPSGGANVFTCSGGAGPGGLQGACGCTCTGTIADLPNPPISVTVTTAGTYDACSISSVAQ